MRFALQLLTLLALLVAPLAAPAAAMAPAQAAAVDCKQMEMGPAAHRMPAGHHRAGEPCCLAIPAAIDPPVTGLSVEPLIDHPALIAMTQAFRLGAGPQAEDPPPRNA